MLAEVCGVHHWNHMGQPVHPLLGEHDYSHEVDKAKKFMQLLLNIESIAVDPLIGASNR